MSDTTRANGATSRPNVAGRDGALAHLMRAGESIWMVEEQYEAPAASWLISLVRLGPQARWMRQRYRYDSIDDVLFFLGERPVSEAELVTVKSAGRQIDFE